MGEVAGIRFIARQAQGEAVQRRVMRGDQGFEFGGGEGHEGWVGGQWSVLLFEGRGWEFIPEFEFGGHWDKGEA